MRAATKTWSGWSTEANGVGEDIIKGPFFGLEPDASASRPVVVVMLAASAMEAGWINPNLLRNWLATAHAPLPAKLK